jgi:MoaA/NifB/PqqE/SkfB family radical SAM enzyme
VKDTIAELGVGEIMREAFRASRGSARRLLFIVRTGLRVWRSARRRALNLRRMGDRLCGGTIAPILALSPTMRCNYRCRGCFTEGRREPASSECQENELSTAELDALFAEAESLGVMAVVLIGGEPLIRGDLVDLIERRRRLVFALITNGSLLTAEAARRIAASGNVVTLVSLDSSRCETDERRGAGAHERALGALAHLRVARACFGYAATVTAENAGRIASEEFVDHMIGLGCIVGNYTEYVPCSTDEEPGLALSDAARSAFYLRAVALRRRKPILLNFTHFPENIRNEDGHCLGAGRGWLHVGPSGDVEPCPLAPVSRENVRRGGLVAAFSSPFLRALREDANIMTRKGNACGLHESVDEIEDFAAGLGYPTTSGPPPS